MSSRKSLVAVLAALIALVALPTIAQARQTIRGPGFKTYVPSGWPLKHSHANGWRTTSVSSPGSNPDRPRYSAFITVSSITVRALEKRSQKKLPSSLTELASALISLPNGSLDSQPTGPPGYTTVAGVPGGTVRYQFSLAGIDMVQTTTALRRHGRIYFVQIENDTANPELSTAAATMVRSSWRWS